MKTMTLEEKVEMLEKELTRVKEQLYRAEFDARQYRSMMLVWKDMANEYADQVEAFEEEMDNY